MLGVEDYGSDNDSDNETNPTPSTSKLKPSVANLPAPSKKSTFSLPPPSNPSGSANIKPSGSLSLPPPKTKRPKKIKIGLPDLPPEDDETNHSDEPPAKKPRIESGARSSALLSMLPAPQNKAPIPTASERVLGGGRGPGLVFKTKSNQSARTATVEDVEDAGEGDKDDDRNGHMDSAHIIEEVQSEVKASLPFLPPSLAKGRANVSVEEKHERPKATISSTHSVDFFSLSSTSSTPSTATPVKPTLPTPSSAPSVASSSKPPLPLLPGVSSAPKVDDFVPPEPTPQDPYPGYYLLPSGAWAAYDPAYYQSFYGKWKREYDAHVRALEKGTKGFEALETEGAQDFNAQQEMEKAKKEIQEREERKALTTGDVEAAAPKMNIKGAALGGRARTRHQLSTLLTEAYQNREALEEKIAMGRRNRKEAGNKYGF